MMISDTHPMHAAELYCALCRSNVPWRYRLTVRRAILALTCATLAGAWTYMIAITMPPRQRWMESGWIHLDSLSDALSGMMAFAIGLLIGLIGMQRVCRVCRKRVSNRR